MHALPGSGLVKVLARAAVQFPRVPSLVGLAQHDGPCIIIIVMLVKKVLPKCLLAYGTICVSRRRHIGLGIYVLVQDTQGGSATIMDACPDVHRSTTGHGMTWHG